MSYYTDVKNSLEYYLKANDIHIQRTYFISPTIIMQDKLVTINCIADISKQSYYRFRFGDIPDFSFIGTLKNIESITIPVPENYEYYSSIMDEMNGLGIKYILDHTIVSEYVLGVSCSDDVFFRDFLDNTGFLCTSKFYKLRIIELDDIDDLRVALFHMKLGNNNIEFVKRKIKNDKLCR